MTIVMNRLRKSLFHREEWKKPAQHDTTSNNTNEGTTAKHEPSPHDVLCGQDKTYALHAGNQAFRSKIQASADLYRQLTNKQDKMRFTRQLVTDVQSQGRFVKKTAQGTWKEISDSAARDKVSHALRFFLKHSSETDSSNNSSSKQQTCTQTNREQRSSKRKHSQQHLQQHLQQQQQLREQQDSSSSSGSCSCSCSCGRDSSIGSNTSHSSSHNEPITATINTDNSPKRAKKTKGLARLFVHPMVRQDTPEEYEQQVEEIFQKQQAILGNLHLSDPLEQQCKTATTSHQTPTLSKKNSHNDDDDDDDTFDPEPEFNTMRSDDLRELFQEHSKMNGPSNNTIGSIRSEDLNLLLNDCQSEHPDTIHSLHSEEVNRLMTAELIVPGSATTNNNHKVEPMMLEETQSQQQHSQQQQHDTLNSLRSDDLSILMNEWGNSSRNSVDSFRMMIVEGAPFDEPQQNSDPGQTTLNSIRSEDLSIIMNELAKTPSKSGDSLHGGSGGMMR